MAGSHEDLRELCGRDEVDEAVDGVPEGVAAACGDPAWHRPGLGEGHLEGVEAGAAGREDAVLRAGSLDRVSRGDAPVARDPVGQEGVRDDEVAGAKRRDQHMADMGLEPVALDGAGLR